MMIRTQIYMPEEMHTMLLRLAQQQDTTLSSLLRQGANLVVKRKKSNAKLARVLKLLANPPKKYLIDLKGKTAVQLIREQRDD